MIKKLLATFCMTACVVMVCHAQRKPAPKKSTSPRPAAKIITPSPQAKKIMYAAGAERLVEITTPFGVMVAKLYNSTPLHRDNFIKLVQSGFYDSLLFHRVISQFMIQGGDPNSKNAPDEEQLGMGSAPGDKIPAEFNTIAFHKKGALAAARDNNAQKASSNCQFYIVQGKPIDETALQQQNKTGFNYSVAQKEIYARLGGASFLDQNYTVFGEVISGLDVIDKIAAVQTNSSNRPVQNVMMKMRMLN